MSLNFSGAINIGGSSGGGGGGSATIESLEVTPSTSSQTITAQEGVDGYSPINVSAVTSSIDSNITAGNIKDGVTILGVSGSVTELQGETQNVSLTNSSGQTFTPSSNKNGITSITVTPNNEARTVTPSTNQQILSVNSGYSGNGTITVNAVTSSIDNNIAAGNIKKDVTILGITGTYEGSGGSFTGITREVSNGVYQAPSSSFSFSLPANATDMGLYALAYAFYQNTFLTSVDLSSLTSISGEYPLFAAFEGCTSLTSADFSSLATVTGKRAMIYAFADCTSLSSLSFPALTSAFGSNKDQFNKMLSGVTGCTVHFPSNLQSVFSSWSDVTNGFGGTNTTILYDLPATT